MKPSDSIYTNSGSSMVGCFAVARARSLVPEVTTPAWLWATIDPINSRFDWCSDFDVPHERGRTIRLTLRGTKNDLGSYVFPDDGDWFFKVTDPEFLRRCALTFFPRGPDHAKRRGSQ